MRLLQVMISQSFSGGEKEVSDTVKTLLGLVENKDIASFQRWEGSESAGIFQGRFLEGRQLHTDKMTWETSCLFNLTQM